jgi:hypothetical protein
MAALSSSFSKTLKSEGVAQDFSPRALKIGITLGLHREDESLWVNGIKQNALFLAMAFQNSPHAHDVVLVNTTAVAITSALAWDLTRFPTRPFAEAKDDLDILIELGGQISPEQTDYLKARGTRIVSYCCGPEYVQNIEAMIFRRRLWDTIFCNQRYDALWVIPQVAETSQGFFETLRRREARVVPFVWHPMAIEARASGLAHGGEYRPTGAPKRLTVIEPNIDVLKFCLYPTLIAERAFREAPESIGFLHVLNATPLATEVPEFIGLMTLLDIVKAGKASFIGNLQTPQVLAELTDIVISHQWGLPLNYLYLEVCWQGYALVHNAHLCREIGYFYPDNDIEGGAQALRVAIETHDLAWEDYRDRQRGLIGRFLATNDDLIAAYDRLLFDLMGAAPAP